MGYSPKIKDWEIDRVNEAMELHRGVENAITIQALSKVTGIENRKLRHIISFLVLERRARIGSSASGKGYYIIKTPEELRRACADLRSRARLLMARASALEENCLDRKSEQLSLIEN